MSRLFAQFVAWIGGFMILLRRWDGVDNEAPAVGGAPNIPEAKAQSIPTLKMPTAKGWEAGRVPIAAPGLSVNAFASGLKHPRWIYVLPNDDVLVAEAIPEPWAVKSPFEYAMLSTMRRATAVGKSANRISLFRDTTGDGVGGARHTFFYVGNTNALVSFAYTDGDTEITSAGTHLADFKPDGHWTRSLLVSPDESKIYIGVGSKTNIAEEGMEVEEGRAAIHEHDIKSGTTRLFATGLRNPVGVAWEPISETLWTVVNERDGLGDEVPPDYLTSVSDGGFYGWPYCYWGQTVDDRVPQDPDTVKTAIAPDYALGGHTASLGLCWMPAGTLKGFDTDGMVIGQHGSWNRSTLSGYKVIFVPFENGQPNGPPRDILSGFLADDEKVSYGRPVGVTIGPNNSLLVADDVGNVIWRVVSE